jgi:hypothetical protein
MRTGVKLTDSRKQETKSKAENLSANCSLRTVIRSLHTVLSSLLIVICCLSIVACEQPSGIQAPEGRFASLEDMASYLAARAENTAETPCPVVLSAVDLSGGLNPLFASFKGRYVSLDLSACVLRDIPAERNIGARENRDRLVSLTLPLTLQSIGEHAFYQSSSLKTLVLPDSLRSIGDSAFGECGIEEVELPPRLQTLADGAFANCPALKRVVMSDSLVSVGTYAFALCPSLAECVLPATPPALGTSVFVGSGDLVFLAPDIPSLYAYQSAPSWFLYRYRLALQNPEEDAAAPEIYFDYGRRRSPLDDAESFSYSSPAGRSLVLAPVLWNISRDAEFVWKVDGRIQSGFAGEYFAFVPREQKTYAVSCSVRAGGKQLTAETRVTGTAPEAAVKRPATENSRRTVTQCFDFTPAPGSFVGQYPVIDFSEYATEESVRQRCQDKLDGKPVENGYYFDGWSLGYTGGYLITGFDHSVEKRPGGKELRIFGVSAVEPGVVWVMQDSNGNGLPDDVWYELKGSQYDDPLSKRRYAITFFKPRVNVSSNFPVDGILWRDNTGNGGVHAGIYPYSVKGASLTFVLSWVAYSRGTGYVDTGTTEFNIADAAQANGAPVDLAFIDFVKVQDSTYSMSGTETSAPQDTSLPPETTITGAALGGGLYRFVFVNNSSRDVTFMVWEQSPFALAPGASKTLDLPGETQAWETDAAEVTAEADGNTLTVSDGGGGDI